MRHILIVVPVLFALLLLTQVGRIPVGVAVFMTSHDSTAGDGYQRMTHRRLIQV